MDSTHAGGAIHDGSDTAGLDLIHIVYVSDAAAWLDETGIAAIRTASGARNRAAGLTGLLLFQDPRFYGVLEGPRRRVLARMEKIATDRRHSRLLVLREEPISLRRFDNWSFGVLPSPAQGPEKSDEFIRTLCERLG